MSIPPIHQRQAAQREADLSEPLPMLSFRNTRWLLPNTMGMTHPVGMTIYGILFTFLGVLGLVGNIINSGWSLGLLAFLGLAAAGIAMIVAGIIRWRWMRKYKRVYGIQPSID